jgi:hypothetical protein
MTEEEIKALRDEALQWAKENLLGTFVKHNAIEKPIEIGNRGLKHTLKGKNLTDIALTERNLVVIYSTYDLVTLLENANYLYFEEDKNQRDNIFGVHILSCHFEFREENYQIKFIIKETRDKTLFYDHAVIA